MNTPEFITLTHADIPGVLSTTTATERRDQILAKARRGNSIGSPASAEAAAAVLRECREFTRAIEEARRDVKESPMKLCRAIDALAEQLTAGVEAEAKRISGILGTWQLEQKRIADDAARRAREEEQRVIREAEEKAAAEAEKARLAREELEAQAARATSAKQAEAIERKIDKLDAKTEAASAAHVDAVEQKIAEVRVAAVAVAAPAPAGISARAPIEFEITDIVALYESAPFLVLMEPNKPAIRAALKGLKEGQSLPGVRHWKAARAVVR